MRKRWLCVLSGVATTLVGLSACSPDGEVPLEPRVQSANSIALSEPAGATIYFDPNTMILSDQQGHQVQLEGETQDEVLNSVNAISETEARIQAFEALAIPNAPCDPMQGNCDELRELPLPVPGVGPRNPSGVFIGRMQVRIDRARTVAGGLPVPRMGKPLNGTSALGPTAFASSFFGNPCQMLASTIYQTNEHFKQLKGDWVQRLKNAVLGIIPGTAQSGALPTPSGTISGLHVELAVSNQAFLNARLILDQLAHEFHVHNCINTPLPYAGGIVYDGWSPSGSGRWGFYQKICTPVWIEIQIEQGVWWEGWGEECEYTFFPYGALRASGARAGESNLLVNRFSTS